MAAVRAVAKLRLPLHTRTCLFLSVVALSQLGWHMSLPEIMWRRETAGSLNLHSHEDGWFAQRLGRANTIKLSNCSAAACAPSLNNWAGKGTCGDHVRWLITHFGADETRACTTVAVEYPVTCGACMPDALGWPDCGPACPPSVLAQTAGGLGTCYSRIKWTMDNRAETDESDACKVVAQEFPAECGACGNAPCKGAFGDSCGGQRLLHASGCEQPECSPGEHLVSGCYADSDAVCHECPNASCAILDGDLHPTFNGILQQQSWPHQNASESPVHVFNPSTVMHDGSMLLLTRITNQTRCSGESSLPWKGRQWVSRIGLCRTSLALEAIFHPPYACRVLRTDLSALLEGSNYRAESTLPFAGIEDPRGFSLNGIMYITGATQVRRRSAGGHAVLRLVVLKLNKALTDAESMVVLFAASSASCRDSSRSPEKNWVFIRAESDRKLLFLHSFSPLTLATCDIDSGCCRATGERPRVPSLQGYRGGSPAVSLADGSLLMVVHRRIEFQKPSTTEAEMPAVYHHRMLLLGLTSLGQFSQVNVSSPFRLPDPPELLSRSAQDIQFVSGLLVSDGYADFMFGAGDCVAGLLRVHSQIKSVVDGESQLHVSRNTVLQIQKGERVVRIEGPVRSTESFAQVNRHILQAALSHDSVSQFQAPSVHAMDTSSRYFQSRYEATCNEFPGAAQQYLNQIMETTLMRSNRQNALSILHASVTIRNSWPPQFMPPLRGQVALYFPWEFYHIPIEFVLAMQALQGEIWVPTSFVKEGLVQSGVPNHKVAVVPHGHGDYDSGSPVHLTSGDNQAQSINKTAKAQINELVRNVCGPNHAFVFLYIGGLLFRKSPIEVFNAFTSAFDRNESACLVMSSSYGDDEAWSDLVALYERALHISWFPLSRVRNADYLTLRVAQTELSKRQARIRCVSDTQCAAVCLTPSGTDILYKSWDYSPQMGSVCKDFCQRSNESARIKCRWSTCSGCGVCSGRIVSEYHAALWDHATVGQCISKRGATNEDVERPKVLILDGALTTTEKQELFSLSGALVHPSRSEGFGLSVAEAMASGLPVITVDSGATADFTSHETAWLVPAKLVQCLQYPCDASGAWRIFGKPMGQPPMWLEFDVARLSAIMRVVMENQDVAAQKAARARAYILEHFSWDRVHKIIRQRIAKLTKITQLTEELSQQIEQLRPGLRSNGGGAPSALLTWQHAL